MLQRRGMRTGCENRDRDSMERQSIGKFDKWNQLVLFREWNGQHMGRFPATGCNGRRHISLL